MRLTRTVVPVLVILNMMMFFTFSQPLKDGKAATNQDANPSRQANSSLIPSDNTILPQHHQFAIVVRNDGPPLVTVDLHDQEVLAAYYTGNEQRIETLLANPSMTAREIEVTVTFEEPLKWEAFAELRDAVGLEVLQYTFAEVAPTGEKWALDLRVMPELTEYELLALADNEAKYAGVELLGVMVAQGTIPVSLETLGRLADDPRVYAADTVAAEALDLLQIRGLEANAAPGTLKVSVPSPYWSFDWTAGE